MTTSVECRQILSVYSQGNYLVLTYKYGSYVGSQIDVVMLPSVVEGFILLKVIFQIIIPFSVTSQTAYDTLCTVLTLTPVHYSLVFFLSLVSNCWWLCICRAHVHVRPLFTHSLLSLWNLYALWILPCLHSGHIHTVLIIVWKLHCYSICFCMHTFLRLLCLVWIVSSDNFGPTEWLANKLAWLHMVPWTCRVTDEVYWWRKRLYLWKSFQIRTVSLPNYTLAGGGLC